MDNVKLHNKKWDNHKQLTADRSVWSPSFGGLVSRLPGASSIRFFLLLTASILYRRITMSHSSHKWLKIWINSLTDPDLDNLTISHFGRWVKLLLYAKTHGENGILKIKQPAKSFCLSMQIENIESFNEIAKNLPNISISCNGENGVTIYTVKNWYKYQIDDSKERVEKHRESQKSVTPQDKNKIREEKNKKREDKIIKHKYGEFNKVLLTDAEHEKLKERFGADREGWITKLDRGIEQKGYKYKSHYLTIIDWSEREDKKRSEFL